MTINPYLASIIPESNVLSAAFAQGTAATSLLEAAYAPDSGFVGAFFDGPDEADWSRRAARYLEDDFLHDTPGRIKLFGDVLPSLQDDGAGQCLANFRHALDAWQATGGVEPYSAQQDYGSCIDASVGELESSLFGWRAQQAQFNEQWKYASAWYKYANRGYCSDGWSCAGVAAVALRAGAAFRIPYNLGGKTVDFTDDDLNERIVARTWCRTGIPTWMLDYTSQHHGYQDGAITRFEGGKTELRKLFAAGGAIHTSGRRTSGGNRPFVIGSTGAHAQAGVGCDDSEEFRRFCQDVLQVTARADDFPVIMMQTWGSGWRGECADAYWPATWGRKPQGAWVWWASDLLRYLSCDYAWLPQVKGFPSETPVPPPPGPVPQIGGDIYAEQLGDRIVIRGELSLDRYRYIVVPATGNRYRVTEKPIV